MGSCSSVHASSSSSSPFGSKTDNLVIPPSPVKEKPKNGSFRIDGVALKSQWSPSRSTTTFADYGSKEEAFFDSMPWLDSDGEDDFYSVKGEFTPSCGTTPVHPSFVTPVVNKTPGSVGEPSPTEKKKKLLELFRESVREYQDDNNVENSSGSGEKEEEVKPIINNELIPKHARCTPYISWANSASNSERTMNEDPISTREQSVKSVQCCLPSLVSCRSFSERRRKMTSPAIATNGKC